MAQIELAPDTLNVHLRGREPVWSFRRRVEVPLANVRRVTIDPAVARRPRGLRAPGAYLPGVIAGGTYFGRGGRAFWSVRHPEKAVIIDLDGGPYARLVVEVADPVTTAAAIEAARRALPAYAASGRSGGRWRGFDVITAPDPSGTGLGAPQTFISWYHRGKDKKGRS